MRAGFEYFRAFPVDAEQNKESAKSKITMPVLVLGGDIYPALGGDLPGNFALNSTEALAAKCKGSHSSAFRTLDPRRAARLCNRTVIQILWKQVPMPVNERARLQLGCKISDL